jgi:ankyrin repeat protein
MIQLPGIFFRRLKIFSLGMLIGALACASIIPWALSAEVEHIRVDGQPNVQPEIQIDEGAIRLEDAVDQGNFEEIAQLLRKGDAFANMLDSRHAPMLIHAILKKRLAITLFLLEKGALPDATGLDGKTALYTSLLTAQPDIVLALLDYGARPHRSDLDIALKHRYVDVVDTLTLPQHLGLACLTPNELDELFHFALLNRKIEMAQRIIDQQLITQIEF